MDGIVAFFEGLTVWHWVGLGIVLMTIEVAVGTFDLLWVAMGAFLTALFALVVPLPAGGWQGQMVFFGVVAIAFVISGRTLFKGLRTRTTTHPHLNAGAQVWQAQLRRGLTFYAQHGDWFAIGCAVFSVLAIAAVLVYKRAGVAISERE